MNHLEYMVRAHQEDLQSQVERYRLMALAEQQGERRRGLHRLAFNWLGNRMIKWGDLLLEHSGDNKPVTCC